MSRGDTRCQVWIIWLLVAARPDAVSAKRVPFAFMVVASECPGILTMAAV